MGRLVIDAAMDEILQPLLHEGTAVVTYPTAFAQDEHGVEITEGHPAWPEMQRRRAAMMAHAVKQTRETLAITDNKGNSYPCGDLTEESIVELGVALATEAFRAKVWPSISLPRTGKTHRGFLKSQASDPILAMASEPMRLAVPDMTVLAPKRRRRR